MFIVFEGLDGAGNTTQSRLLAEFLKGRGHDALLTKEPTQNPIGKIIRDVLQHRLKTSPLALQLLFVTDRAHHFYSVIDPALKKGQIVVSDRYMFSTFAFGGLGVDEELLKELNEKFRIPDLTFIIDVPAEVAMERIKSSRKGKPEFFEDVDKFKGIRANYLKLKDQFPNVHVIDGNRPIEAVAADVQKIVLEKLE